MAFDGILVRALRNELDRELQDARINKIAQPEPEELIITFKTRNGLKKVLISANASLPLIYLTEDNKQSPATAPGFCMLLRKHLNSARLLSVTQPGLERVIVFTIEHLDEMGDLKLKYLNIELMGKYSNIIFTDDRGVILDAIRHVPPSVSSVRTVLPGQPYFIPDTQNKINPESVTKEQFLEILDDKDRLSDVFFRHFTGFSGPAVQEILYHEDLDPDRYVSELSPDEKTDLADCFIRIVNELLNSPLTAEIAYENGLGPVQYSAVPLDSYRGNEEEYTVKTFDSPSLMLKTYFSERNITTNMRQKSQDMRKVAETLLSRAVKKLDLQKKQMKDTEKRETYRLYGELLNAYSYQLPVGEKTVSVLNYYDNTELKIPTDPDLSIADNAKRYFDKYTKQKRTCQALEELIPQTESEIEHLSSIVLAIDIARDNEDLQQIREEMADAGFIKRQVGKNGRKIKSASKPWHYISSDGYDIYVGRNNLQNDMLTFKFADGNDIWMHAKKAPGSHVIIRTRNEEIPDRTYEEAGALAVYYSTVRDNPKAEVDYIEKKHVKKPNGGAPGFVVYYTNYSLMASPDISALRQVND